MNFLIFQSETRPLFVGFDQAVFLFGADAGVGVVGGIAEDDEDGLVAFDFGGGVAFGGEFGEGEEVLLGFFLGGFPSGEGVGEEDAGAFGFGVVEGSAEGFEEETELEVGDDEGGGHDFEAVDAVEGGLLEIVGGKCVGAFIDKGLVDAAEDGAEVGAGAAAGVEDDDVGICEAVGDAEFGAEDGIDAFDLVVDDFGGGVPDAKFLAEVGVEFGEEGFVEVLDGVGFLEAVEEKAGIDAVEGGAGPVEDFGEVELFKVAGVDDVVEEGADHGDAQEEAGVLPVEAVDRGQIGRSGFAEGVGLGFAGGDGDAVAGVDDPGGEHAVEEGLNEGGAEEMLALVAFEVEAEGGFEGGFDGGEGGEIAAFDAGLGFASVGGEEAGDVLRGFEGGVVGEDALEIFLENGALFLGQLVGMGEGGAEGFFVGGEFAAFEDEGIAVGVGLDEGEGAEVGGEDEAVAAEVFGELFAFEKGLEIVGGGLDFHDAASGEEFGRGVAAVRGFAELVGGVEAAVWDAGAAIGGIDDAGDLGLERIADAGEQLGQGGV